MQNKPLSLARRIVLTLSAVVGLMSFSGCDVTVTNLTPPALAENPSQIYTIETRVKPRATNLVPGSLIVRIIIDGKSFVMSPSPLGQNIYQFDYHPNPGVTEIAYYVLVNYQFQSNGITSSREEYTALQKAKIVGRYVLSLEVNRGPIGSRVSILGRGFTAQDVVYLDNTPARTVFESPNSISFFVPAVDANRNYKVQLGNSAGGSLVGTFRVDPTSVNVSPAALSLRPGETQTLSFTLPTPAPTGGLLLDITTDVPESVIMPEVVVPAGSTSVTINVTGGKAGTGSLFLKGFGAGEVSVPVTVR